MPTTLSSLSSIALLALAALPAEAQKKWTQIGATSSGNPVFVEQKSVKKTGNLVSATVRIVFLKPVETPKGTWTSGRVIGTFDCAARKFAAKESAYYGDKAETKIIERKVNKIPGYSVVLGGSLGAVALDHVCGAK